METFVMTIDKWKYNYRLVKRQFWTIFAVLVVCVMTLIIKCGKTEETPENYLDEAIEEYEANGGHKIYPYGRACLLKKAIELKLESKEQMRELLEDNKAWIEK